MNTCLLLSIVNDHAPQAQPCVLTSADCRSVFRDRFRVSLYAGSVTPGTRHKAKDVKRPQRSKGRRLDWTCLLCGFVPPDQPATLRLPNQPTLSTLHSVSVHNPVLGFAATDCGHDTVLICNIQRDAPALSVGRTRKAGHREEWCMGLQRHDLRKGGGQ